MVNNGSLHYDHDRDGTHTQLAGCESKFRNSDHDSFVSIRYENDRLIGIINKYFKENMLHQTKPFHFQSRPILTANRAGSPASQSKASGCPLATTLVCRPQRETCPTTTTSSLSKCTNWMRRSRILLRIAPKSSQRPKVSSFPEVLKVFSLFRLELVTNILFFLCDRARR